MEITKQKSFATRTSSNIAAGIMATIVFWLLAALALAVVVEIGELVLPKAIAGTAVEEIKGQLATVAIFGATLYLISGPYKEFGFFGAGIGLMLLTLIVPLLVPAELKSWVAENCNTFPWFGIIFAALMGMFFLAIYYCSMVSGFVFDYIRNKFGIDGNVFSHFEESADKNKIIFRLPMLWSLVSFVLIALYSSINVALDPQAAQRAKDYSYQVEEQILAQELSEQFDKTSTPVKDTDAISNLFTFAPKGSAGEQQ